MAPPEQHSATCTLIKLRMYFTFIFFSFFLNIYQFASRISAYCPIFISWLIQRLSDTVTSGYCDILLFVTILPIPVPKCHILYWCHIWYCDYHIGYCDCCSSKFGSKVPYVCNILPIWRHIFLLNHQTLFKNAKKHQNCWIKVTPSFLWYAGIGYTEPPESISCHISILLLLDYVTILDTVTICPCPMWGHSIR